MSVAELFAVILICVGAIQVAIWIPLVLWFRSRSRRWKAELPQELTALGETIERGPERASYQGASTGYKRVKGAGMIVLTDRRLLFRKFFGGVIEVPLNEVTDLREAKGFLGKWSLGRPFLIVKLASGAELGFMVSDHSAWVAALGEHVHA